MIAASAPAHLRNLRSAAAAAGLFLAFALPTRAADLPGPIPDAATLTQMEQHAAQADPRERCFLYTELSNALAESAGRQLLDGDVERAHATLQRMAAALEQVHKGLTRDTRRLKNAEMIMHRTVFRMSSFLRAAPGEDRPVLQAAIRQADALDTELMAQVFSH